MSFNFSATFIRSFCVVGASFAFLAFSGISAFAVAEEVVISAPSGANFRTGKNTRIIRALPRGTRVEVLRRDGNWSVVSYQGTTGYIYTPLTRSVNPQASLSTPSSGTTTPSYIRVTADDGVNFRAAPQGADIGVFAKGTQLQVLRREGNLYAVSHEVREGYVYSPYVE